MTIRQPNAQKSIRPQRMILGDETYETIRLMVLTHEIAPGERIKIDGLARDLDVSQTPVREALARLESEDLVLKVALKGYAATQLLSVEQLDDLFRFRALIEPWAAAAAAQHRSEADIKALRGELLEGKAAGELNLDDAYAAMSDHDARFHELVATISGNGELRNAFVRTHCHLHLFRLYQVLKSFMNENREEAELVSEIFKLYYQPSGGFLAFKEHEAITEAIIAGKSNQAEELMRQHIESSRQRFGPTMSAIHEGKNASRKS